MRKESNPLSWPDIDYESADTKKKKEKQAIISDEQAKLFKRLFDTDDGKKVMEYWENAYLSQPVSPWTMPESYGRFREGNNHIIMEVKKFIKQAAKGK